MDKPFDPADVTAITMLNFRSESRALPASDELDAGDMDACDADSEGQKRQRLAIITAGRHTAARYHIDNLPHLDIVHLHSATCTVRQVNNTDADLVMVVGDNEDELLNTCRHLLQDTLLMPLVVLMSDGDSFRESLLLEMGARDVLFLNRGRHVTVSRLRSHMSRNRKRTGGADGSDDNRTRLRFGRLAIDLRARAVYFGDAEVRLTTAEFDTLWMLARNAGHPVKRKELMRNTRNQQLSAETRLVDYRVNRLRKRLEEATLQRDKIRTVRSAGYMLAASDW